MRLLALKTGALISAILIAWTVQAAEQTTETAISVRGSSGNDFQVLLEPTKATYQVDEPIRFRIRGNKRFFLYLYTIDPDTEEATLILPNAFQTGNQYAGNRTFMVPNKKVEFFSAEPGTEKIVMVASRKYIDLEQAKDRDFSVYSVSALEGAFEAAGIEVRGPSREKKSEDVVIQEFSVNVQSAATERPKASDDKAGFPYISLNKTRYSVGDTMTAVYGATQDGTVHIYVVEPAGGSAFLSKRNVKKGEIYELRTRAESPIGKHRLVAVYTQTDQAESSIDMSAVSMEARIETLGVSVIDDEPVAAPVEAVAVYPFVILR